MGLTFWVVPIYVSLRINWYIGSSGQCLFKTHRNNFVAKLTTVLLNTIAIKILSVDNILNFLKNFQFCQTFQCLYSKGLPFTRLLKFPDSFAPLAEAKYFKFRKERES